MPTLMYLPPGGKARRGFLRKGLFGGALLALGGAGFLATRSTKSVPLPQGGLKVLSESEFAVVSAICARCLPPRKNFPPQDELSVPEGFDAVLSRADEGVQKELKQLIGLFENGLANAVFGLRFKPFTQLSASAQDEVLHEWETSRLTIRRTGFQALRTIVMAAYYGNPKTWTAVGYPGPPPMNDPNAPVWKGGSEPRPEGPGVFHPDETPPDKAGPADREGQP
ncbi:MAG: gluconate 2-dehydrogenase subunit 3 family protein [Myxococcaceae bacterium]